MRAVTLDAAYYRDRADLCRKLAVSAEAAKPLFARLFLLAEAYQERAKAADLSAAAGQAVERPQTDR
jgi:hypothetical protein